ncbi:hypothetical protein DDZ16_15320 [Marinilabilia rubra]|uniref:Uncharacterized protein n=1 Tax=Marinilabilia rubra TaxID=2162893 RepID=A0A2U2B5U8_9BACT|nr:hypothetical protein DDZ16_15320 [Marinilabilia rubra]
MEILYGNRGTKYRYLGDEMGKKNRSKAIKLHNFECFQIIISLFFEGSCDFITYLYIFFNHFYNKTDKSTYNSLSIFN